MSTTTRGRADRRPSITDVAKRAGVSVGTVSNVLNRPDQVSDTTRDRVLVAIEELQFVRNASARQLRAGTIQTVGAIVLDIANPFFTEVARGVEDRLAADEYTLMLVVLRRGPRARGPVPAAVRGARRAGRHGHAVRRVAGRTCSPCATAASTSSCSTPRPRSTTSRPSRSTTSAAAPWPSSTSSASGTRASRSSTGRSPSSSASTGAPACSPRSTPPASTPPTRSSRSPSARSTPTAARPASTQLFARRRRAPDRAVLRQRPHRAGRPARAAGARRRDPRRDGGGRVRRRRLRVDAHRAADVRAAADPPARLDRRRPAAAPALGGRVVPAPARPVPAGAGGPRLLGPVGLTGARTPAGAAAGRSVGRVGDDREFGRSRELRLTTSSRNPRPRAGRRRSGESTSVGAGARRWTDR